VVANGCAAEPIDRAINLLAEGSVLALMSPTVDDRPSADIDDDFADPATPAIPGEEAMTARALNSPHGGRMDFCLERQLLLGQLSLLASLTASNSPFTAGSLSNSAGSTPSARSHAADHRSQRRIPEI
jgi:hypothetical protein